MTKELPRRTLEEAIGHLKNIYIDSVSGNIATQHGRVEFLKLIEKYIYQYWPDWKGEFGRAYPQVTNSVSQAPEFIVVRTRTDKPMRVDTVYDRGSAPMTKTPAQGQIKPKLLGEFTDKSKEDKVNIWTRPHDCILEFYCLAKSFQELDNLVINFEQFMIETEHIYIKSCLSNLVYLDYSDEVSEQLHFDESYRAAYFLYWIQYEKVWVQRLPRVQALNISTSVSGENRKIDRMSFMSELVPDSTVTVSNYNGLSPKIPPIRG